MRDSLLNLFFANSVFGIIFQQEMKSASDRVFFEFHKTLYSVSPILSVENHTDKSLGRDCKKYKNSII